MLKLTWNFVDDGPYTGVNVVPQSPQICLHESGNFDGFLGRTTSHKICIIMWRNCKFSNHNIMQQPWKLFVIFLDSKYFCVSSEFLELDVNF